MKKTVRRFLPFIIRLILLFVLVYGAYTVISMTRGNSMYSAVFLDNGQVYFGEVKHTWGAYTTLSNVYYFGPSTRSARGGQVDSDQANDIVLVKLGSELHGPTDNMEINRDHILFIEKLKGDGRVMKAIQEYESDD